MNSNRIFTGNIYKITKQPSEEHFLGKNVTCTENNILIKLNKDEYVRLEDFHYYLAIRKLFPEFMKQKVLKEYNPYTVTEGSEFIEPKELKPYISAETEVSLKIAKKRQVRN